jgi:hypothetical protein
MASVSAVNTFSLREGVSADEFEQFSRELDRPTCLEFDEVEGFEVYLAQADAPGAVDVVEIMTVTSWPAWEAVRDTAPQMESVVRRFGELVEVDTVTTYFTRRSPLTEEG